MEEGKKIMNCHNCGKELTKKKQHKYCSHACMWEGQRKERKEASDAKLHRVCETCGKDFIMHTPSGKARRGEVKEGRFCSRKCRWGEKRIKKETQKKTVVCKVCGSLFERIRTEIYCSDDCRKKKARNDYYVKRTEYLSQAKSRYVHHLRDKRMGDRVNKAIECKWCGMSFIPKYNDRRRAYCSPTCQKRSERISKRLRNDTLRRREVVEERPVERFKAIEIYERDGWRCGICGKKVDKKLKAPNYKSPSIDHIVPISKGGLHERKNVRLAHWICNSKRGDKTTDGGDQLRLFG